MPALTQIGDYVLKGELGRGAHGVVYRAHHSRRPDVPVALKVVENRGNLDRLMLEPALLSKLDHPCIVGLDDFFLQGDDLVLTLEFIQGQDLKSLLDEGKTFSQAEVRDLLVQLLAALAHAHARSIVHRDLKPANILVVADQPRPRYVLTDFGIGRAAEGIQFEKHVGGTYLFMAPEQLRGRPGPQSDLWALGVVAYRLVTGRLPFEGKTLPELSQRILYGAPTPPSEVSATGVDPALERVILKLLEKSLQERYAGAADVLGDLGYRGDPDAVLSRVDRPQATVSRTTVDQRLGRAILWRRLGLGLLVLVYLCNNSVLSGLVFLAAAAAFMAGQARVRLGPRLAGTIAGLALFLVHAGLRFFDPTPPNWRINLTEIIMTWVNSLLVPARGIAGDIGTIAIVALTAFGLTLTFGLAVPVLAGYLFVSVRLLQRERILRRAALAARGAAADFLEVLRDLVDRRFEDVDLHLKYVEALFAGSRFEDAAAEATVLLEQDPYHFGGNLILANSLERLGLYEDCVAVCDAYLDVSAQCFEFHELREHCLRKRKAS